MRSKRQNQVADKDCRDCVVQHTDDDHQAAQAFADTGERAR